jgi:hypothetical protein
VTGETFDDPNFQNLLEFYQRELAAAYARATIFESEWTGFTGILGIADEWKGQPVSVWHWSERPKIFTPAEFDKLWGGFSEARRVEYVLSLIT